MNVTALQLLLADGSITVISMSLFGVALSMAYAGYGIYSLFAGPCLQRQGSFDCKERFVEDVKEAIEEVSKKGRETPDIVPRSDPPCEELDMSTLETALITASQRIRQQILGKQNSEEERAKINHIFEILDTTFAQAIKEISLSSSTLSQDE